MPKKPDDEPDKPVESNVPKEASKPATSNTEESSIHTIDITDELYGNISFSYDKDDASIKVYYADEGEDLDFMVEYDEKMLPSNFMDHQKIYIRGEDFNILMGFADYSNSPAKTFSGEVYFRRHSRATEISVGGLDGISYTLSPIHQLEFPAVTQYGARIITLYPLVKDDAKDFSRDDWEALYTNPKVLELLDAVVFSGDLDPITWETTPISKSNFTATPTDGWLMYTDWAQSVTLRKDGMSTSFYSNGGAAEISVASWGLNTPQEWVDEILESKIDTQQKQLDNYFINGREFLLVKHEKPLSDTYELVTSAGSSFDPNSSDIVVIKLSCLEEIEPALPMLEKIVIG